MKNNNIIINKLFTKKDDNFLKLSNNKNIRENIKYIIIHHIMSKNIIDAIELLKKHKVSSHYIIDYNNDSNIIRLVDDHNIAYHAGHSYFNNDYNLNNISIGIELFSPDPYRIGFSTNQMKNLIELIKILSDKYNVKKNNIIGHNEIAYDPESSMLGRKDDPSYLFDWQLLYNNNLIKYYDDEVNNEINNNSFIDRVLYKKMDKDISIQKLKYKFKKLGYLVNNNNDIYDKYLAEIIKIFNHKYKNNNLDGNEWHLSCDIILNNLL